MKTFGKWLLEFWQAAAGDRPGIMRAVVAVVVVPLLLVFVVAVVVTVVAIVLKRLIWPPLLWFWKWLWRPRRMIIAGAALFAVGYGVPAVGMRVAAAGVWLLMLGVVQAVIRRFLLTQSPDFPALVTVNLVLAAAAVGVPALTVVLATSGAPGSAPSAVAANEGQPILLPSAGIGCLFLIWAVVFVPQRLRRRSRCMNAVSELARTLLPSWLAAVAAVATWGWVFMLRFGQGSLSGPDFKTLPVAVGAAGVAVLLVPLYQFTARACWQHGIEKVLDPVRWLQVVRDVLEELDNGEPENGGAAPEEELQPGELSVSRVREGTAAWRAAGSPRRVSLVTGGGDDADGRHNSEGRWYLTSSLRRDAPVEATPEQVAAWQAWRQQRRQR